MPFGLWLEPLTTLVRPLLGKGVGQGRLEGLEQNLHGFLCSGAPQGQSQGVICAGLSGGSWGEFAFNSFKLLTEFGFCGSRTEVPSLLLAVSEANLRS